MYLPISFKTFMQLFQEISLPTPADKIKLLFCTLIAPLTLSPPPPPLPLPLYHLLESLMVVA